MSELSPELAERKLWFDGPNYTADAIVIDPIKNTILLVKRQDTGDWALPAGFIDPDDASPAHAAARETYEETNVMVEGTAPLIFRGIVDDPRNDEHAWIETSAHLFMINSDATSPSKSDEAEEVAWRDIADLPHLYASHQYIVERALDYLTSSHLVDVLSAPDSSFAVDGGHMEYTKSICKRYNTTAFTKQHSAQLYSDPERAERSLVYLEKEAAILAHLRQHQFMAIPEHSLLHKQTLAMDAFLPEDGWQWRAESSVLHRYIDDTLRAFSQLEAMPIPADVFPIEATYESFHKEGWRSITPAVIEKLHQRLTDFLPRLTPHSQAMAREMMGAITLLQNLAQIPTEAPQFVFCHHDARQSNIAWHPETGSKLIDWSWADLGVVGSDSTSFLIDLHKSGHDIAPYYEHINPQHCLALMGFWLAHSTWPDRENDTVRFQQFVSALSAYEIVQSL